jgi:hypothetical protein
MTQNVRRLYHRVIDSTTRHGVFSAYATHRLSRAYNAMARFSRNTSNACLYPAPGRPRGVVVQADVAAREATRQSMRRRENAAASKKARPASGRA